MFVPAILYLTMYIILFTSAWRLRRVKPDVPRTFRVPAIGLFATVGCIAAFAAILLAFIPPAQFGNAPVALYVGLLLIGVVILGLSGQIIFNLRKPGWNEGLAEIADDGEFEI